MANTLKSIKKEQSEASISSERSSNNSSSESSSESSPSESSETSIENVTIKKIKKSKKPLKKDASIEEELKGKKLKRKKRKGKFPSKELTKTEKLLQKALGDNVPANKPSDKKKIKSTSRIKSIESTASKKKKATKFRFPKSKSSSQSGQYSHIKSRYLNVFKKTEEPNTKSVAHVAN